MTGRKFGRIDTPRARVRVLVALLLVSVASIALIPIHSSTADASISIPAAVSITVAPQTLPADGGSYPSVFVTLADQSGLPALASSSTTVFLTSSQTNIGLVLNSSIVIGAGKNYAVAYLRTTATPGQTTVTASSAGLKSGDAQVKTGAPTGYPSVIALSSVPAQIAAESQYRGIMIVQLQDSTGLPARAVSDMQVRLLSSNVNVLNVSDSVTIASGNFSGSTAFVTGLVPGQAIVTATSPGFVTGSTIVSVSGPAALGLKLFAQPDSMVACTAVVTSCTGRLVVALTDQSGNPARASSPVTVQIRSSNLSVLHVPLTVVISQGNISATATYTTTAAPGKAVVTVSAPDLRSDTATVTTTLPGSPTALKLFVGPDPVLADHRSYSSVVASLLDKNANPAVNTTGPTHLVITSSLGTIGTFSSIDLTIQQGQNSASTVFTSTFLVGHTSLTVSGQNLVPAFALLTSTGAVPSSLIITPLSQSIPADGGLHPAIEVSLQDSFGQPAFAPSDLAVFVSSDVSQVVQFNSPIIVPAGRSAALVNGTTTTDTGTANITAYASLQPTNPTLAKSVLVSTVTPAPSAVAAFTVPSKFVVSKAQQGAELAVQLQDSRGDPSRARHDTSITITSSASGVFNRTIAATIPQGQDLVFVPLVPRDVGSTQFTASSSGLVSSSVDFSVLAAPIQLSLSPSLSSILQNQTDALQLTVTFEGKGLAKANVTWTATGGTASPPISQTDSSGVALTTFTPTATGVAKITAVVIHPALVGENLTTTIIVTPVPPKHQPSILDLVLTPAPYIKVPYVAFAVVAAVVLIVFVVRRRRVVEEVVGEGYEGAPA